jgi:hypothetical protein
MERSCVFAAAFVHMRVFGVVRLALDLLSPSLVVLRRLTVKLQSHHVHFVRSTASTVKNVLIFDVVLYAQWYYEQRKPRNRGER